jgi:hypothetical protein
MSGQITLFADEQATKSDQVVAIARELVTKRRGCDAAERGPSGCKMDYYHCEGCPYDYDEDELLDRLEAALQELPNG